MKSKILVDASHPEEKRVAIISEHNKLEEFEFETSTKQNCKGNIYLAKIIRVEPSLQAAFVDYGGNRHGFLAFGEIHPIYYQILAEDKEKIELEVSKEQLKRKSELEDIVFEAIEEDVLAEEIDDGTSSVVLDSPEPLEEPSEAEQGVIELSSDEIEIQTFGGGALTSSSSSPEEGALLPPPPAASPSKPRRYRIQEVIKRNQIILVQVVKEERGNKGAALTTYLSLAGRYSVLMPNTANAGGISRKIANLQDRKRLREVLKEIPTGPKQSLIIRTAGQERTKAEIKRDFEYLSKTWDKIYGKALKSMAPCLLHEEGDIVGTVIRDLYSKETEQILIEGEEAYKTAKNLMKILLPSHAKKVQLYKEDPLSLFRKFEIEQQIDDLQSPVVSLPSGGSLVISVTEALVAIDINSGRSTKERHIDGTALHTNLEAATEIARQLRLRDLGGLIVIDFIDMDNSHHIHTVEKRLREALKQDRARIQTGKISQFGLLELSRQRLRPSLLESLTQTCKTCGGKGHVRSVESTALALLRALEEEGVQEKETTLEITLAASLALYLFNKKWPAIALLKEKFNLDLIFIQDLTFSEETFVVKAMKQGKESKKHGKVSGVRDSEGLEQEKQGGESGLESQEDGQNRRKKRKRKRGKNRVSSEDIGGAGVPPPPPPPSSSKKPLQDGSPLPEGPADLGSGEASLNKKKSRHRWRKKSVKTENISVQKEELGEQQGSSPSHLPAEPPFSLKVVQPVEAQNPPVEEARGKENELASSNSPPKRGWWKKLLK